MRYVIISYQPDGTVNVFGTPSGHAFASLDAAKDGRDRLLIQFGLEPHEAEMYLRPVERVENLR